MIVPFDILIHFFVNFSFGNDRSPIASIVNIARLLLTVTLVLLHVRITGDVKIIIT